MKKSSRLVLQRIVLMRNGLFLSGYPDKAAACMAQKHDESAYKRDFMQN